MYCCLLLFILVLTLWSRVLNRFGCILKKFSFVGLVCVVLCGWCLCVLFFCLWARPIGRARFRWVICCVCLSCCLEKLFVGGGMMLWCVVLGVLFGLVVFSCIVFCILCIISVPMSSLSSNIKCEESVYVIWGFA